MQVSPSQINLYNWKSINEEHSSKLPQNDCESSPSFTTDQHFQQALYFGDSFTLTSDQSQVSQFEKQSSYDPSLHSCDPSNQFLKSELSFSYQETQNHNLQNQSQSTERSKEFQPQINSLIAQINVLESDLYTIAKEYMKMKTLCFSIISSLKHLISKDVGRKLEEYAKRQLQNQNISLDIKNQEKSHFSKHFLKTLNSESLSFDLGKRSRQMSKHIEEIFTLGQSQFKISKDTESWFVKNGQNSKKTQKKAARSLKKNKSKIATQLLCQVCGTCFQPNQFFKHVQNCTYGQESRSSLKSTSKLAFNYTLMMDKLFGMREEIQSQIQLLSFSKQQNHEKAEREKLRKRLEQDLQKVTHIIKEKQKQMEIHVSKSFGFEISHEKSTNKKKTAQKN